MIINAYSGRKFKLPPRVDAVRVHPKAHPIAWLFSKLTRTTRHIPRFEYSKKLYTHNVFRFLESIFGRKDGIRPSISTTYQNGEYVQKAHCLEAQIALLEVWIRNLKRVKIRIMADEPVLAFNMGGMKMGLPSGFMFAIAVDASNKGTASGSNTLTISHTCTGSNLVLLAFVEISADDYTVTYNSASMTELDNSSNGSSNHQISFIKVAPSTGANNAVFTPSGSSSNGTHGYTVSYTGCQQSGQPDAHTNTATGNFDPFSMSITTVADNCWVIAVVAAYNGTPQASTGTTLRIARGASNGNGVYDSNGPVAAGNNSLNWTLFSGGPSGAGCCILSLSPVPPAVLTFSVNDAITVSENVTIAVKVTFSVSDSITVAESVTISEILIVDTNRYFTPGFKIIG